MSQYFQNKGISNSMLGWFKESPMKFYLRYNNKIENEESKSLKLGSLIHTYNLEPDKFKVFNLGKMPSESMCKFIETYYKEIVPIMELKKEGVIIPNGEDSAFDTAYNLSGYKISKDQVRKKLNQDVSQNYLDYLINKSNDDEIAITSKEYKTILEANEAVLTDDTGKEFLSLLNKGKESFSEEEIYWEKDGVKLKSKIDNYIELLAIGGKTLNIDIIHTDVKTTSSSIWDTKVPNINIEDIESWMCKGFASSFIKYNYYRQLAFYEDALLSKYTNEYVKSLFGLKTLDGYNINISINHRILAIKTTGRVECAFITINDDWIKRGKREYNELLADLTWHLNNDVWEKPKSYIERGCIEL